MTEDQTQNRRKIMEAIQQGLGRGALSDDARAELLGRVTAHRANLSPQQAQADGDPSKTVARFVTKATAAACTVQHLPQAEELPEAVAAYLRDNNLGSDIRLAPGDFLQALPWERAPMVNHSSGTSDPADMVSLTTALAGVAETGTLVMTSGADDDSGHPTGLNFTPDHHLVALRTSQVHAGMEEVWQLLRKARQSEQDLNMPRSLNMITGPSRTGDIGLQIQMGAHGPRRLHILLIDDTGQAENQAAASHVDGDRQED